MYAPKSTKLPKDFASLVLDHEMKVESSACDFDSVNSLLQLYSVSFLSVSFLAESRRVLFRHERWKVHLLHWKNLKFVVPPWHPQNDEPTKCGADFKWPIASLCTRLSEAYPARRREAITVKRRTASTEVGITQHPKNATSRATESHWKIGVIGRPWVSESDA